MQSSLGYDAGEAEAIVPKGDFVTCPASAEVAA